MESRWASLLLAGATIAALAACAAPAAGPSASPSATAGPSLAARPSAVPGPTPAAAPGKTGGSPAHLDSEERAVVADNKVVIVFPNGGAALTETADRQLDVGARLYRDANPVLMTVAGYADPQGGEYQNLLLSARRAEAVKQGLVARGLPADRLLLQAFGQSVLANSTDPLAAENRRVVITWQLPGG